MVVFKIKIIAIWQGSNEVMELINPDIGAVIQVQETSLLVDALMQFFHAPPPTDIEIRNEQLVNISNEFCNYKSSLFRKFVLNLS